MAVVGVEKAVKAVEKAVQAIFAGAREQQKMEMQVLKNRVECLGADQVKKEADLDREERRALLNWCSDQAEILLKSPLAAAVSEGAVKLIEHHVMRALAPNVPTSAEQAQARLEAKQIEQAEEGEALHHQLQVAQLKRQIEYTEQAEWNQRVEGSPFGTSADRINEMVKQVSDVLADSTTNDH